MKTVHATTASMNGHKVALLISAAIAVVVFSTNLYIALKFDSLQVYDQYNVLFDTDVNSRLKCFTKGSGGMGRTLAHPNLCNFVNPPIQVLGKIAESFGIVEDGQNFKRSIGLAVTPIVSATLALVLFRTFYALNLSLVSVLLLTFLGLSSFSQLIFGSIPEHLAIGGFGIALAYFMAAKYLQCKKFKWWLWLFCGVIIASITITNVIAFTIVLWSVLISQSSIRDASIRTISVVFAALALTLCCQSGTGRCLQ